jgi:Domain of unknown function (DUF5666)
MYKRIICLAVLFTALLFAHNGMEHVMGTVTSVSKTSITVETVDHKSVTVLLNPTTKFIYNNVQSSLKDLKAGDRVVIHAKVDPNKNLLGVEVKSGSIANKETMK